ncbi:putative major facilitator, sugar transporter, MFS transporter superfamily [Helianthus anomalus]
MIVCIMNIIFSLLTSNFPDYWTYVLLRLLTGFSNGGIGVCAFVLPVELIGPAKRGIAGMSTFYFSLNRDSSSLRHSLHISILASTLHCFFEYPSSSFLFSCSLFISESPCWYLVRGKSNEAMKIMHKIAKSNGKHLPESVYVVLDKDDKSCDHKSKEIGTKEIATTSVVDVIKSPSMRKRLFLLMGITVTSAVVYYRLNLNATNLNINICLNVLFNSAAEMPA